MGTLEEWSGCAAPTAQDPGSRAGAPAAASPTSTTTASGSDEREVLERIRELAIPPAWKDVWICPYPNGHLQATGVDAAGRKQYRYHDAWRTRRDAEKFDDMTRFARALPQLRERVELDLAASDTLTRERVLACAVRLLDRGFFRIGTEEYAVTNESYGLATIRKEHVTHRRGHDDLRLPGQERQAPHPGRRRPALDRQS